MYKGKARGERYDRAIASAGQEPTEEETQAARELLAQVQGKARVASGAAVAELAETARRQGKRIPKAQLKWYREAFVLGYTAAITEGIVDKVVGVTTEPVPETGS